jgi:hypothetical protein
MPAAASKIRLVYPTFFRELRFSSNPTNKTLKEFGLALRISISVAIQK